MIVGHRVRSPAVPVAPQKKERFRHAKFELGKPDRIQHAQRGKQNNLVLLGREAAKSRTFAAWRCPTLNFQRTGRSSACVTDLQRVRLRDEVTKFERADRAIAASPSKPEAADNATEHREMETRPFRPLQFGAALSPPGARQDA